jgi:glycine/D-amino acid oxidase-like deaminating enzyme
VTSGSEADPVVVIGAGAIGLCTAFYLRQAGRAVTVIDRAGVGNGSSWGNAGWVCLSHSAPVPAPGVVLNALRSIGRPNSPLYLRPELSPAFARWLWHFWRACAPARFAASYAALAEFARPAFDLFDELNEFGVETTLTRPGLLHAFLSPEEAQRTLAMQRMQAGHGYQVPERPSRGSDIQAMDRALSDQVRAAYLVEGEGVLEPGGFTAALAKCLSERGVPILEQSPVVGLRTAGSRVRAVSLSDSEVRCSDVVIAAGTWSADLTGLLGIGLPLQAGKGYSFSAQLQVPPRIPMYFGDKHMVTSPIGGLTRFAGTMEFSGNNRHLEWRRIVSIAQASTPYLGDWFGTPDDLVGMISDPWVGGRPMLPDGLPVLDQLPGHENAYLSTGHGMLGITLAPASGKLLAQYVATGVRPAKLQPFRFDRVPGVHRTAPPPDSGSQTVL